MSLLDKHLIPVWMEHSMISEITLDRYIPEPVFVPGGTSHTRPSADYDSNLSETQAIYTCWSL